MSIERKAIDQLEQRVKQVLQSIQAQRPEFNDWQASVGFDIGFGSGTNGTIGFTPERIMVSRRGWSNRVKGIKDREEKKAIIKAWNEETARQALELRNAFVARKFKVRMDYGDLRIMP